MKHKKGSKEDLQEGLGLLQATLMDTASLLDQCITAKDPTSFAKAAAAYHERVARDARTVTAFMSVCLTYAILPDPENN